MKTDGITEKETKKGNIGGKGEIEGKTGYKIIMIKKMKGKKKKVEKKKERQEGKRMKN